MSSSTPILTQLFRPTRQEVDGRKLPAIVKRFFGFVLACLLLLVGPGLLFVRPWSILTCRQVDRGRTDCSLEKRIAWFFATEERSIAGLRGAELRWEYQTRIDDDGERTRFVVEDVVLIDHSGELSLAAYDESWSEIARPVAGRINGYLETPTGEPLTVLGRGLWLHTLSTLAGLVLFLFFGLVFVGHLVGSLLLAGVWTLEGVLAVAARAARRRGRAPQPGGKIDRLLRAVRSAAISPREGDTAHTGDRNV